tara:strand:+ start:7191 stop:7640 length:450 start_codon:yes stop_codon:yes gene_type:complete
MAGVVNGSDAILLIGGKYFILATSHNLSVNQKTRDITVRETNNWHTKIAHRLDWTIECEGLFGLLYEDGTLSTKHSPYAAKETEEILENMYHNQQSEIVKLLFMNENKYFQGNCFLSSYSIDAPMEDSATISLSFVGDGDITTQAQIAS